jgi:hypothetical protein
MRCVWTCGARGLGRIRIEIARRRLWQRRPQAATFLVAAGAGITTAAWRARGVAGAHGGGVEAKAAHGGHGQGGGPGEAVDTGGGHGSGGWAEEHDDAGIAATVMAWRHPWEVAFRSRPFNSSAPVSLAPPATHSTAVTSAALDADVPALVTARATPPPAVA